MKLLTKDEATRTGKLDSDEYRLANEIRFACALSSKADRDSYFRMVENRDGKAYAAHLREMAMKFWDERRAKQ